MNKKIAIVPVSETDTEIPSVYLRYLGAKPLIFYIIEAAKESDCFSEIYINSNEEIYKQIAEELGVKFYKRPKYLSNRSASLDDIIYEFTSSTKCDDVVSLSALAPFITSNEIQSFMAWVSEDTILQKSGYKIENHDSSIIGKDGNIKNQNPIIICNNIIVYVKSSDIIYHMDKFGAYINESYKDDLCFRLNKIKSQKIYTVEDFTLCKYIMQGQLDETREGLIYYPDLLAAKEEQIAEENEHEDESTLEIFVPFVITNIND